MMRTRRVKLYGPDDRPLPRERRQVAATYDNAATTTDNSRHWANADHLSATAANSLAVRKKLRNRSRYEIANNSFARGITLTLANDTIGTGPRLQLGTPDPDANHRIEAAWEQWSRAANLACKLHTLKLSKTGDGEGFATIATNPAIRSRVKLDLELFECDRITDDYLFAGESDNREDGIEYDAHGNPSKYHVLRSHPGDESFAISYQADPIDAANMIHLFRADRPGQRRGIPEITPALGLFAELRRFCEATIAAAETAADIAGAMETENAPIDADDGDVEEAIEAGDAFELERRLFLTLPRGSKLHQMKAEHPSTTYVEFVGAVLREIARCLNMPFNIAAGDSSGYNYASGRLDHQTYFLAIQIERFVFETQVLDRLLSAWWEEAILVADLIPPGLRNIGFDLPHQWRWDSRKHVDPVKEATAAKVLLANNATTLARLYGDAGLDWETELRQRAKEVALCKELGLTTAQAAPPAIAKPEPTK